MVQAHDRAMAALEELDAAAGEMVLRTPPTEPAHTVKDTVRYHVEAIRRLVHLHQLITEQEGNSNG